MTTPHGGSVINSPVYGGLIRDIPVYIGSDTGIAPIIVLH